MWACTQVYKLALLIETDLGILWKILDQFYIIRLIFFLEIRNCIGSGLRITGNRKIFFYDLLHLLFNLLQIFCSQRSLAVHVIIESVRD